MVSRNRRRRSLRVRARLWALGWVASVLALVVLVAKALGIEAGVRLGGRLSPVPFTAFAAAVLAISGGFVGIRRVRAAWGARVEGANRQYLERLSDAAATFTYVLDMDSHRLVQCNPFMCEFIGYSEAQIVRGGLPLMRKLTHPDDWPTALKHFADIADCPDGDVLEFEQRLKNAQGEWRWILFRQSVLERRVDGTPRITRGTGQDITERKEIENALRQGREMLDGIIDCAAVGMALVAPDGNWLRVNNALCEFFGYADWELLEGDFQSLTHPEDLESDLAYVEQMLEGTIKTYTMEKRYLRKDGAVLWATLSVSLMRDTNNEPLYFLSQVLDITARKSEEEAVQEYARLLELQASELSTANLELQHLVSLDPLTGVFNRRMLDLRLKDAFELAKRFHRPLALIMLDVDHFKRFNDEHGHVAGDQVLRSLAGIIRDAGRASDVVARFGGEEFAVICPDTTLGDARALAERLAKVTREFDIKPRPITCSFGVCAVNAACRTPKDLIELADAALYLAKSEGRDRVCTAADLPPARKDALAS